MYGYRYIDPVGHSFFENGLSISPMGVIERLNSARKEIIELKKIRKDNYDAYAQIEKSKLKLKEQNEKLKKEKSVSHKTLSVMGENRELKEENEKLKELLKEGCNYVREAALCELNEDDREQYSYFLNKPEVKALTNGTSSSIGSDVNENNI